MSILLYTLGYEGLSFEVFLARLKTVGVETVIDVRANPLSRKRGFSKHSLAAGLEGAGLAYKHTPAMGCPKNVRDQYKRDQDWAVYTQGYLAYLASQPASLSELITIAESSSSCLICFEADFTRCHRMYVARAAARYAAFQVRHLTAETEIAEEVDRSAA